MSEYGLGDLSVVDPPLRCLLKMLFNMATFAEANAIIAKANEVIERVEEEEEVCARCLARRLRKTNMKEIGSLMDRAVKSFEERLPPVGALEKIIEQVERIGSAVEEGDVDGILDAAAEARRLINEALMLAKASGGKRGKICGKGEQL